MDNSVVDPGSLERSSGGPTAGVAAEKLYTLLDDRPFPPSDPDPLGMKDKASGIASILEASIGYSPFVLAVDAGWGMGKSTLLGQIEHCLPGPPKIAKLHFNAWTAQGENALEGLIKAVLSQFDRNVLRRYYRKFARKRHLVGIAWLTLGIAARFFGVTRIVDELWARLAVDAKTRNDLRDLISDMLKQWVTQPGQLRPGKALVVFIDDLDRCSDNVVIKICEAVKLYLDAPGIIFVIACDQSVLARSVSLSARGGPSEGRAYLEKIVQVAYRMPVPEVEQFNELIREYAGQSHTDGLIDYEMEELLAKDSRRNPRRIKRIINSFVLEYRLDPAWQEPKLGPAVLIIAILLQHLHPQFYDLLVTGDAGEDPISDFLNYAAIRERIEDPPPARTDKWWTIFSQFAKEHLPDAPEPSETELNQLPVLLQQLERKLPAIFKGLVDDADHNALVLLLNRVKDPHTRKHLGKQLADRPLATAVLDEPPRASVPMTQIVPGVADYYRAVQAPARAFTVPSLQTAEFEWDSLGPRLARGADAVVFTARVSGSRQAVRCYIRNDVSSRERYEILNTYLASHDLGPHVSPTIWLDEAIKVNGATWPVLLMDWIDGRTLNEHVDYLVANGNTTALTTLAANWRELVRLMQGLEFAHGDLEHANIMVDEAGTLRLVDYDAVWVPQLARMARPTEYGHFNYQHLGLQEWGQWFDTFSALVIYLSLVAVGKNPQLWRSLYNGTNLLFTRADFRQPFETPTWQKLAELRDPEVDELARRLRECCDPAWAATKSLDRTIAQT